LFRISSFVLRIWAVCGHRCPLLHFLKLELSFVSAGPSYGPGLLRVLSHVLSAWGWGALGTVWRSRRLAWGFVQARRTRRRLFKREGLQVPVGFAISPTMRCNLSCKGCYARLHPRDGELSAEALASLVGSASQAGVSFFVITGGEPYIKPEMLDIYREHPDCLFLTVTNGTLVGESVIAEIARLGNVFPIVSLEGRAEHTDSRRGSGVHQQALSCMRDLKTAGVPFGFSVVLTRSNMATVGSDEFVGDMVRRGSVVGFYNEFIPLEDQDWAAMPDDAQQQDFRESLGRLRKRYPVLLLHLPDDEYDENGRCTAVGGGAFHVNAQGFVEPCPFAHFARENVNECSFEEILRSPFLRALREHPTALRRGNLGCSLVSNREILERIARETGAIATRPR
jgi:MoaA/NifB/PqqE/SkfB family radical SAM enzyme